MLAANPRVSVIIPYHSHGRHLHQACTSALRASRQAIEVIIVNDGSPESKADFYLRTVCDLSPAVRVIAQPNHGLSAARNVGIAAARGEFVQLLDSDDMLTPAKIDLQLDQFAVQPRLSVSITGYAICNDEGLDLHRDGESIGRFDFSLDDFLFQWERGFSIPIHCALFRRAAIAATGFDTSVGAKEDWIFWSQLAAKGHRFGYLPILGAIYRQHHLSMSKKSADMAENWLAAARIIAPLAGDRTADFMSAVRDHVETFYRPRIEREAARQQPVRAVLVDDHARGDWIAAAAQARLPTSANPLVSVIVPVFNHVDHLPQCLSSIVAQNACGGAEIVVVDDASTDPRVRPLLQAFAAAVPGVKLLQNAVNQGICRSQNLAVESASGAYVAFLDCDDALPEGALARVAARLTSDVGYLFTDREDIDDMGRPLGEAKYGGYSWLQPSGDIRADLLDGMVASHLKVIRRELYRAAGGADPAIEGVQDWDLALRLFQERFVYLPEVCYLHRRHESSVTTADSVRQFWLTNVVRRRYGKKYFPRSFEDDEAVLKARVACAALANSGGAGKDVAVIRSLPSFSDIRHLKAAWQAGKLCVYVPDRTVTPYELCVAREFNSFFDGVLFADELMASHFTGFMWRSDALHLSVELAELDPAAGGMAKRS